MEDRHTEPLASSAAYRRLFAPRGRKLGAALTRALLTPPTNCYPNQGDADYHRPVPMAWNLYRCVTCAARREPERWWHRLGWWLTRGRFDPFGRTASGRSPW